MGDVRIEITGPLSTEICADLSEFFPFVASLADFLRVTVWARARPSSTPNPDFSPFCATGLNKIKHLQLIF
jgi:hypothetical protein